MSESILAIKSIQSSSVGGNLITRPANTTTYTIGDALADATGNLHYTFPRVVGDRSKTGEIVSATMVISGTVAVGPEIDLLLFHTDVGVDADNAPNTLTNAELLTCVGVVTFATGGWTTTATDQINIVQNIALPFNISGTRELYGYPIMQNGYVPESAETFFCSLRIRDDRP